MSRVYVSNKFCVNRAMLSFVHCGCLSLAVRARTVAVLEYMPWYRCGWPTH